MFPESKYKITGSIGKGRVAFCPWIAIMNKEVTTSTQNGVYLVFLFSQDLKKVYFSLAQGITNVSDDEIIKTRDELRINLNLESKYLRHFNNQEISGNKAEKYKLSAIYSNEWLTDNNDYCLNLMEEAINSYIEYMKLKDNSFANISSHQVSNNPFWNRLLEYYIF